MVNQKHVKDYNNTEIVWPPWRSRNRMVAFEPVAWLTWPQHITGQGLKDLPTVKGDPLVSAPIGRLGSAPVPMESNRTPNEKSGNDAPG